MYPYVFFSLKILFEGYSKIMLNQSLYTSQVSNKPSMVRTNDAVDLNNRNSVAFKNFSRYPCP